MRIHNKFLGGQVLILELFMFGELMNWKNLGISGQKISQKVSFLNWYLSLKIGRFQSLLAPNMRQIFPPLIFG